MPNMIQDGLLIQAVTVHAFATLPTNSDYNLQNTVQTAVNAAAATGVFTVDIDVSASSSDLVQQMIERLINMGYGATLATTTLTVTW